MTQRESGGAEAPATAHAAMSAPISDSWANRWGAPVAIEEPARRLSLHRVLARVLDDTREPARIGHFELLARLGGGGMGVVYAAHDPRLDRRVALKLLRSDRTDPSNRLLREAQALARLNHPNIVAVHEVGVHEGSIFVAMELIEGTTLAEWLRTSRSPAEIVGVFLDAGRGLAAAHAAGLVHRDFKPGNVLIGNDGRVRVSDFGLVRLVDDAERVETADALSGLAAATSQTDTGALLGTPRYMSPEQFGAGNASAASDQFSFCVSLHEALFGEHPFEGDSLTSLGDAVRGGVRRPAARRRGVPARAVAVIERGLSIAPGDRFGDMDELLRALAPGHGRWRWLALGIVGVGLTAGLLGALGVGGTPCAIDRSILAGAWNEGRRVALRETLVASGGAAAERAATTTEEALDRWSEAWLDAQRAACEDARIHGRHSEAILDRRSACLDRLRGDFTAIVDVLVDGRETLHALPRLLEGLPSIQRCANLDLLGQVSSPPVDASADEALLAELARGHALRAAGRSDEATAVAAQAHGAALGLGDGPRIADARFLQGLLAADAGDVIAAVDALAEAATIAEAHRHDLRAAEARVELAQLLGQLGASAEERQRWFPLARAAVERLGDRRDPLTGTLAWAEAARLETEERWAPALTAYDEALTLGTRAWPKEDDRLLRLALRRAIVAGRPGRHAEADRDFDAATAAILRRWGPKHRWYANALFDRGQFEIEHLGEIARGEARISDALAVYRGLPGADVEVAWAAVALAQVAYLRGDHATAEARTREGLALLEAKLGTSHPDTLIVVDNLGAVLFNRGDLAGARELYTRALDAQRRLLGPEHAEVARLESHLGEVLLAEGDARSALARFDLARRLLEAQRSADHLDLLVPFKGLGLAHLALGEPAAAREALTRARAVLDVNPGADPVERGECLWGMARALVELGDDDDPRALAQDAERAFAGVGDPRAAAVAAWLADLPDPPSDRAAQPNH